MDVDSEILAVHAAQTGSEQAWRYLFERHFDAVYRFCVSLAAGRRDVAEEVAHQAFVIAARRINRFDPGRATFRAWLLGIARNRYLTLEAKERRRRCHEVQPREREGNSPGRPEVDLLVHEALARLPLDYRRALEDKYLRRLTMKEMAESDGLSIEAIESLLRRARDRFAHVYEQMRDEK